MLAAHANLAYYIDVARRLYRFQPDDVFCALARYTFSISLFELLSPLCCGGSLNILERDDVLGPDRLVRALEQVTVVHAGPSLLGSLFRYLRAGGGAPRTFPRMRHASSGGDIVPPHLIEEMKRVFDAAELYVIYGCTEVSCMGTTFPISRDAPVTHSFVGKAFPGTTARVLDAQRSPTPPGEVGEIVFAGPGVVPGYLNRPELTAEKFAAIDGARGYTTGDLGRVHADGNIEILGRRDFQVQVRGVRVELQGIENTIREMGLAEQCAVVARRLDDGDVRLVVFAVAPRETDIARLRRALAARLPDSMLPHVLVPMESMPLTHNGKLDRSRLQALAASPPEAAAPVPAAPPTPATAPGAAAAAAESPLERQIAAAFAGALRIASVAADDDFFDRGGDSLLAVTLIQELQNTLGLAVPPGALFEHPTARGLAAHLEGKLSTEPRPIALNRSAAAGDAPALFLLLGVHIYRPLAQRLDGRYAVYGVYAGRELTMLESPDHAPSVPELARDYIEIIRRQQPRGPYRLGGMSFGGMVAYEVAQLLRAAGERVLFLGMLDTALPQRGLDRALRLATLPPRDALKAVWNRLRAHTPALGWPLQAPPEPAHGEPARRVGPLEELRERCYRRAADDYVTRVRPFAGDVTLVVAGRRVQEDLLRSPTCGWESTVTSLQVHRVDSDHLGLLEEPKVAEVATILPARAGPFGGLPLGRGAAGAAEHGGRRSGPAGGGDDRRRRDGGAEAVSRPARHRRPAALRARPRAQPPLLRRHPRLRRDRASAPRSSSARRSRARMRRRGRRRAPGAACSRAATAARPGAGCRSTRRASGASSSMSPTPRTPSRCSPSAAPRRPAPSSTRVAGGHRISWFDIATPIGDTLFRFVERPEGAPPMPGLAALPAPAGGRNRFGISCRRSRHAELPHAAAGADVDGARHGLGALLGHPLPHRRRRSPRRGLGPALGRDVGPGLGREARQQRARRAPLPSRRRSTCSATTTAARACSTWRWRCATSSPRCEGLRRGAWSSARRPAATTTCCPSA